MDNLEMIAFVVAFLIGVIGTSVCIVVVMFIARIVYTFILFTGRRNKLKRQAVYMQSKIQSLIQENEHLQSDVDKLAYDLSQEEIKIKDLQHIRSSLLEQIEVLSNELDIEKMRLHPKYNKNVIRGSNGRYKSLKQN